MENKTLASSRFYEVADDKIMLNALRKARLMENPRFIELYSKLDNITKHLEQQHCTELKYKIQNVRKLNRKKLKEIQRLKDYK